MPSKLSAPSVPSPKVASRPACGDAGYLITRVDVYQRGSQRTQTWLGRQVKHFLEPELCQRGGEELVHASFRSSSCRPVTSGWSRATAGSSWPRSRQARQRLWHQGWGAGGGERRPASSTLLMLANYTYQSSQDAMCNYQLRLSTA